MNRRCTDPLKLHPDKIKKKGLRNLSVELVSKYQALGLTMQHKLCRQCCEKLESCFETTSSSPASPVVPTSGQESDCDQTSDQEERTVIEEHTLSLLNESLDIIGESPLSKQS